VRRTAPLGRRALGVAQKHTRGDLNPLLAQRVLIC